MACRITEIVLDCADPSRLAAFWCDVLGYRVTEVDGDWVSIGPVAETDRPIDLLFVPADEPKQTKLRLHIDVSPTDRDQDAELERLLALGARHVDIGQGEQTWFVLADPEGNEFCLLRTRVS